MRHFQSHRECEQTQPPPRLTPISHVSKGNGASYENSNTKSKSHRTAKILKKDTKSKNAPLYSWQARSAESSNTRWCQSTKAHVATNCASSERWRSSKRANRRPAQAKAPHSAQTPNQIPNPSSNHLCKSLLSVPWIGHPVRIDWRPENDHAGSPPKYKYRRLVSQKNSHSNAFLRSTWARRFNWGWQNPVWAMEISSFEMLAWRRGTPIGFRRENVLLGVLKQSTWGRGKWGRSRGKSVEGENYRQNVTWCNKSMQNDVTYLFVCCEVAGGRKEVNMQSTNTFLYLNQKAVSISATMRLMQLNAH